MGSGIVRSVKSTQQQKSDLNYISLKDDGQVAYWTPLSNNFDPLSPSNSFVICYNMIFVKVSRAHIAKYGNHADGRTPSEWLSIPQIVPVKGTVSPYEWFINNRHNSDFETFISNSAQGNKPYSIGNDKQEYRMVVLSDGNTYKVGQRDTKPTELVYDKVSILSMGTKTWENYMSVVEQHSQLSDEPNPDYVGRLHSIAREGAKGSPRTTYSVNILPPILKNYDVSVLPEDFNIADTIRGGSIESQLYIMRDYGVEKWAEDSGIDCPLDFSLIEKKSSDDVPF
jgi:hypothetical protein